MGHHGQLEFEIEDTSTDNADVIATVHTTDDEEFDKVVPPKWRDLFVAAPDMLEALTDAGNVLAGLATGQLKSIQKDSPVLDKIRAAILKAKGEA